MSADATTPAKYDPELVGETILIEIIEQHPTRLMVGELVLRIVADPDDGMEVEIATEAIRDLRRSALVHFLASCFWVSFCSRRSVVTQSATCPGESGHLVS